MAKLVLNITEDHIKLIKFIKFQKLNVSEIGKKVSKYETDKFYGVDVYDLYGGTFLYEQMAYILGYTDKVIPGTEEDVTGPKYPDEVIDYFNDLDGFIVEHIVDIYEILCQFCEVGIKPGKYVCKDYQHIWKREE